jgi:small subunit ribosomal protein S17e
MGRIKTVQVKRASRQLMSLHGSEFTESYEKNKEIVNKLIITQSKKLRNIITGYVTRLVKQSKQPKSVHIRSNSGEDAGSYS